METDDNEEIIGIDNNNIYIIVSYSIWLISFVSMMMYIEYCLD